jgi:UDP-glucose 4-epimerase
LKVLVTGASGFLGGSVVPALLRRGYQVRALMRSATKLNKFSWADRVEIVRGDLRTPSSLATAFDGVDALVHLAARVGGGDAAQMTDTVAGTERLLESMARSKTRRLVLASSFSVYGWSDIHGTLTEESPLETDLYRRDGYAIAKTWQERITRRASDENHWDLTVLRPGFIWGRDHTDLGGLGQKIGRWHLVFGPLKQLPLTHVDNCADCFAAVVENARAIGETFNVVDGYKINSWRYLGERNRRSGLAERRIPIPYPVALSGALSADLINRWFLGDGARLPGLLVPCRFRARFKPLHYSTQKLEQVLNWRPPLDLEECLKRTYDAKPMSWAAEGHPLEHTRPELHHA